MMARNWFSILSLFVFCERPLWSQDFGTDLSGGGHKFGIEAAAALRLVPSAINQFAPDLLTKSERILLDLIANSESTLVMIVERPLPATVGGTKQYGTAFSTSTKAYRMIEIFKGDWASLRGKPSEQIAFMAHEASVLAGIEKTGQYGKVSAELLNRLRKVPPGVMGQLNNYHTKGGWLSMNLWPDRIQLRCTKENRFLDWMFPKIEIFYNSKFLFERLFNGGIWSKRDRDRSCQYARSMIETARKQGTWVHFESIGFTFSVPGQPAN